tara:strand:+ start:228 stop:467 length:240 start_codon:yes stop_codon:yes gene_type:complete
MPYPCFHNTDNIIYRAKLAPIDWADRSSICFSQLDDRDMFETDSTDWVGFYKEFNKLPRTPRKKKMHNCLSYINKTYDI